MAAHASGDTRVIHRTQAEPAHIGVRWRVACFARGVRHGCRWEMKCRFGYGFHIDGKGLTAMARGAVIGNAQVIHYTRTRTVISISMTQRASLSCRQVTRRQYR